MNTDESQYSSVFEKSTNLNDLMSMKKLRMSPSRNLGVNSTIVNQRLNKLNQLPPKDPLELDIFEKGSFTDTDDLKLPMIDKKHLKSIVSGDSASQGG